VRKLFRPPHAHPVAEPDPFPFLVVDPGAGVVAAGKGRPRPPVELVVADGLRFGLHGVSSNGTGQGYAAGRPAGQSGPDRRGTARGLTVVEATGETPNQGQRGGAMSTSATRRTLAVLMLPTLMAGWIVGAPDQAATKSCQSWGAQPPNAGTLGNYLEAVT